VSGAEAPDMGDGIGGTLPSHHWPGNLRGPLGAVEAAVTIVDDPGSGVAASGVPTIVKAMPATGLPEPGIERAATRTGALTAERHRTGTTSATMPSACSRQPPPRTN